ncbi:hypothetical protein [Leifsonia aquatica]|uniref:hypothetical protein n=1 Tax=Leifsonia aquatica TaxID=144185 RepID=UPI0038019FD3
MAPDNEGEIANAIGESSLENISEAKLSKLVELFDGVPEDVQIDLMKTNSELQRYALKAVSAVEENLKQTLASNDASTQQTFAALTQIREAITGQLNMDNISDERWRFLIEKLIENGQMAVATDTANKQFLAQQASSDRLTKTIAAAMPHLQTVVQIGAQLMLARSRT